MQSPSPHDPIAAALAEDIGSGDLTSAFFVARDRRGNGRIFAKEPCVLAGGATAGEVFHRVDASIDVAIRVPDGTAMEAGDTAIELNGPLHSILTAERVALNFIQRLSGVATRTREFVRAAGRGGRAVILDTRKTTPGLRLLEKAAVVAGGGKNHRIGLFDMVMVKDNHLLAAVEGDSASTLGKSLDNFRRTHPHVPIELEADTLDQVRSFLDIPGIARILLDNMTCEEMREAVRLSAGRVPLEASGGVSLETVEAISATGVDFISVGAITHSARAVDFSLELSP